MKTNKKSTLIALLAVLCVVLGFCLGKMDGTKKKDKVDDAKSKILLNVDGVKKDITDVTKSYEKACVLAADSVVTDFLGFSKTEDAETKSISYVRDMHSFTFYPGETKYVYNNKVYHSPKECVIENNTCYVNVLMFFLDTGAEVTQSDNEIFVKKFFLEDTSKVSENEATPKKESNKK